MSWKRVNHQVRLCVRERRLTPVGCDCRLFRERLNQMKVKLDEVLTGKAGEYKEPLAALQRSMQIRTQVAGRCESTGDGPH